MSKPENQENAQILGITPCMTENIPPCAYLQSISMLKQVQFALGNIGLGLSSIRSIVLYVTDTAHGQDFFMALRDLAPNLTINVTLVPVGKLNNPKTLISCDVQAVGYKFEDAIMSSRFSKRDPKMAMEWWKWA